MQPRTEGNQRCVRFSLDVAPPARPSVYQDYLGNVIHNFDIPATHVEFRITAESLVEVDPLPHLPEESVDDWCVVESLAWQGEFWDYMNPSRYVQPTGLLRQYMCELDVNRALDPLSALRKLNSDIYKSFDYAPQSTRVDSPIDEAIAARRGVCQDLAHIMIAVVRQMGIPCRYVSGYLYHRRQDHDRSAEDATHAWVEAYLPALGWVGFDPTNDLMASERHIRVAVGRDYADVPPTRGIFVGDAEETLEVGVRVTLADAPPVADEVILPDRPWTPPSWETSVSQGQQQQQQQ